jgi:hypothetical protein
VQHLKALLLSTPRLALVFSHFSSNCKTDLTKEVKKKEAARVFKK